ncbi:tyrosine-protein phosphatase siw14 [Elasticomyces elasticus]|nr:tyrosine-protein phosphatase siw14 [Elasticomyces elasticus]
MGHLPESYGGSVKSATEVVYLAPAQEIGGQEAMDGVERLNEELKAGDPAEAASRPPSPPESGTVTPALRIPPCPSRLMPLVPPPNYGASKNGTVFRSAYPQDRNLDFLKLLGVRSLLCLVETEPSEAYSRWIQGQHITRLRVDIAANKEGKTGTTWDSLCEALLIVMDSANYPLYIHCNQGKHRTGCLIACLRKIQHWDIDDIIAEYQTYAWPKARPGDIALIRSFDPEAVFDYAKRHGHLDNHPFMKRSDSIIANIDGLADALAGKAPYCDDIDVSMASNASTFSDDSMDMDLPFHNAGPAPAEQFQRPSLQRTMSQLEVTSDSESAEPILLDPSLSDTGATSGTTVPTTSVVELSEDMLSPPEATSKMLDEQPTW